MSGLEIAVGASTIGGFLSQVSSHELLKNKSSKIRVPLTQAKDQVSEAIDTLQKHQQILNRAIFDRFFAKCKRLDRRIDEELKDSLKKKNIITKTLKHSGKVKQARQLHNEAMSLINDVKFASLEALVNENDKDDNIKAKAQDAAIAAMERDIKFKTTMRKHRKLFQNLERQRSGPNKPPVFFVDVVDDTTVEWEEHRAIIAPLSKSQVYF